MAVTISLTVVLNFQVDLRPPFGREGCVPPGYGRDARTGATPESPSWRSSDRPGEVIWRGGASASGLSSGTLPPPPPRLGTLGLSLPPGINISSSGDTSVVDTGPGSAEIEAGEIPSDTPAAVTSGAMMPMSWEMKLVSTIGKAPHLQSPFHRTASLPSVHSPSSKVPMGITRKLSESALSLEDDPGSALPMIEIKDPMASDVRLEPRRPQAADHSIRLEPRRPILSPGLSPLRGFSVRLDPRSKTEAVPSSVSEPAPDATTPQGLAAASGNLQTRDCSISTSATPATETKEPEVSRPPKRKRLGWGQGLAARVRQPPTPVSADATEVAEDEAKASQDAPAPTGSADDAVEKTSQEGTAVKKMTIGKEEAVLMETSAAASAAAVDEGAASEGTVAPREVPTEKCPAHKEKSSETGLVPGDSKGEMEEQQPPGDDLPMEEDASQVNLLGSKGVNEEAVLENQRLDTLSTADEAEVKLQDAGAPPGDATVEPSETSATETSANAAPEAEEPQHQVDEGRAEMPLPEAPEPPQGATEVESEASPASADVDADVADLGDVKDAPSPRATPAQEPKSQGISPPATPRSSLLARAGPSPCLAGSPEVRPTASVRADPAPIKPPTKCVASAVCASKPALPLPSSPSMESPSCPLSTAANVSKTVENMESGKPGPVVPSPLPPPSQDTALLDGHQQTAVPTSQQSVLSLPTLPSIQIQTRAACISPVPTVTVVSEAGGAAAEGQQRKKQLKAEMFVRIEDVENDMEAIEKQLAIANTELDTSRERFKAAESEVQALQRGPEVPEISSDESDISSMSEDDDMDTVAAVEAEDEEFESEEKRLTGLLKEIQSNKELRDANMAAEKARHEQSLKVMVMTPFLGWSLSRCC